MKKFLLSNKQGIEQYESRCSNASLRILYSLVSSASVFLLGTKKKKGNKCSKLTLVAIFLLSLAKVKGINLDERAQIPFLLPVLERVKCYKVELLICLLCHESPVGENLNCYLLFYTRNVMRRYHAWLD